VSVTPPLLVDLSDICAEAGERTVGPASAAIKELASGLSEPLTIAVIGSVDAGKSTLVNAVVNRRIAPTNRSETTRLVTQFSYGKIERAVAHLKDGSTRALDFDPHATLPEEIGEGTGLDPRDVALLDVTLSNGALFGMTIIDTPGLDTIHHERSLRTTEFLGARQADAVLFVFDGAVTKVQRDTLHWFRVLSTGLGSSPVNTFGVLSKIDELGSGEGVERWVAGRKLAASNAKRLGRDIASVVPVMGLLAETANAGRFREDDATNLYELAKLPVDVKEKMLNSEKAFKSTPSPVREPDRLRLLELLRLYGLRLLIGPASKRVSAKAMTEQLLEESGFVGLQRAIDCRTQRRVALKASRTITKLEEIAAELGAVDRDWLLKRLEGLSDRPDMHKLKELRVISLLSSGESSLSRPQTEEALRILTESDPSRQLHIENDSEVSLLEAASEAIRRWNKITNVSMSPRASEAARVVTRTLELLLERLEAGSEN